MKNWIKKLLCKHDYKILDKAEMYCKKIHLGTRLYLFCNKCHKAKIKNTYEAYDIVDYLFISTFIFMFLIGFLWVFIGVMQV